MKEPKLSKLIKSINYENEWRANFYILDEVVKIGAPKFKYEYIEEKDIIKTLIEAEERMNDYNVNSASNEVKRFFITLYLMYKIKGTSLEIHNSGWGNRNKLKMENFISKIEKYTNSTRPIVNYIKIILHVYPHHSETQIWISDGSLSMRIDISDKDPIEIYMDFVLNPKKYLDKFGLKKVFIPKQFISVERAINGTMLTLIDNYKIEI